ncbi:MAG: metallophosphoesterase [Clostridia bacterium]|nr:metallophosphoesterase [Clostridia bacterium]
MDYSALKHPLRFSEKGIFRVLMMSDIQESAAYDERSLRSVCALLDETKPDLVIWGGDNCYGPEIHSADDLQAFLDVFTAPMEKRKIPWAHVFGNHDHDVPVDISVQQEMYERYPFCVSMHTDDSVHGKSNFVLPVYDSRGENVLFHVWGLDTNNEAHALDCLIEDGNFEQAARLPNDFLFAGHWEIVYFDQLMWYWNTSVAAEKAAGRKIPGLLCMHIAPHEFAVACANPQICVKNGSFEEPLDPGVLNSGLFSAVLQRGDIRIISCGHTHRNDFEAEYCKIRLCWDACAGYRCYGVNERRGGRLFEIRADDPWNIITKMIRTEPLLATADIT